jgi:hypothetical protein
MARGNPRSMVTIVTMEGMGMGQMCYAEDTKQKSDQFDPDCSLKILMYFIDFHGHSS